MTADPEGVDWTMVVDPKFIRNFSIIAHIDHGKSTLADQLLLQSGAITQREFREQLLDDMDLERERGITIKARAVAINYTLDGQVYELNLIDTPGHVDFHYEVSRSLAACEGAILLVDATQGVQAQTVANAFLAAGNDLAIVPVLNKIDMQASRPDVVKEEIMTSLGIDPADVLAVSAKTGQGVPEVFRTIVERVPPPAGDPNAPLRALIFDSKFDDYQGVITYVRVVDGVLRRGQKIQLMADDTEHEVTGLGRFRPREVPCDELGVGQVGYVIANIKRLSDVHIGDTITQYPGPAQVALPGYKEPVPVVFCGLFPATNNQFDDLRTALQKLALNDSSFTFEPETSDALGFGFRCGFLGMLHMEIVQQRLERESNLSLVQTAPNVTYEVVSRQGEIMHISNPTRIPDAGDIEEFREPIARLNFIIPSDCIGAIMQLCEDRRGVYLKTEYLSPTRAILSYELPLAEMIYDLYDKLKSATRGYGTMDYEVIGYRAGTCAGSTSWWAASGWMPSRCVVHRAACRPPGPEAGQEAQGGDRSAPVRGGDPGRDRQPGDRPRDDLRPAEERHRQVLRRRHHAETQAPRKAKRGEEAYETGRERRDLAGCVPRRAG